MPQDYFHLIEGDIFNVKADVLAFSSNPTGCPTVGCLDSEIYERAGWDELFCERICNNKESKFGDFIVTGSYALSDYYWLFHIVTPLYMGDSYDEEVLLGECYKKCLIKAHHLISIHFLRRERMLITL